MCALQFCRVQLIFDSSFYLLKFAIFLFDNIFVQYFRSYFMENSVVLNLRVPAAMTPSLPKYCALFYSQFCVCP